MKLLVDSGADVNVRDNKKRTPLHIAAEDNTSANAITALIEGGADVDARDDDERQDTILEIDQLGINMEDNIMSQRTELQKRTKKDDDI